MKLEDMSLEELKRLKHDRYSFARESGKLDMLRLICREFGSFTYDVLDTGYVWKEDGIRIYINNGDWVDVTVDGVQRVSTACELYTGGEWESTVYRLEGAALQSKVARESAYLDDEKRKLLEVMG